jgi:fucose 4-O-acetylase-like acetyltransferase
MANWIKKDLAQGNRVEWIDVAKGLGISLVVLAHVLAGISVAGMKEPLFDSAARFINVFHMPVFLVLAGVFAPRAVKKPSFIFWRDKLANIVYPYVVWSIIQIGIQILMSRYTNTPMYLYDFYKIFYQPPMQFWFLYGLFLYFVVYRIIHTCGGSAKLFFFVSILMSLSLNFCNLDDMSVLGRMRDNLPYFALGAMISQSILLLNYVPSWILSTVIVGGFGLTAVMFNITITPRLLVMLSLPLLGVVSVFCMAILLIRWQIKVTTIFTYIGQMSLEIYLVHVLAYSGTRILLLRMFGITSSSLHLVSGIAMGFLVPTLLAIIAKKCKFPYLFRWST